MSANTSPDNITYPTSGDAVSPLETVFATQAASVQAALTSFRNTKLSLVVADLTALAAVTGMSSGQLAIVTEGGAIFEYNGTIWVQQTAAQFATTGARTTAYAKASGAYLVAWTAQSLITGVGSIQLYNGSVWISPFSSGMQPVVPTSVAGTGVAVGANGAVTYTASTTVSVNGCFTSTYDNYFIAINFSSASVASNPQIRMRLSGTDNAASSYNYGATQIAAATATILYSAATTQWVAGRANTTGGGSVEVKLYSPAITEYTKYTYTAGDPVAGSTGGGAHSVATAYDGFSIIPTSGNVTGTLRIYGINNN